MLLCLFQGGTVPEIVSVNVVLYWQPLAKTDFRTDELELLCIISHKVIEIDLTATYDSAEQRNNKKLHNLIPEFLFSFSSPLRASSFTAELTLSQKCQRE